MGWGWLDKIINPASEVAAAGITLPSCERKIRAPGWAGRGDLNCLFISISIQFVFFEMDEFGDQGHSGAGNW